MFKRILIMLGWRGKICRTCHFSEAAHIESELQWHPDSYPCDEFTPREGN